MVIKGEVLLAHGRQPRRRFSAAEKIALVEEAAQLLNFRDGSQLSNPVNPGIEWD